VDQLPPLARVFAYLSLLTIGGGMAAFPEMKHELIDVHHWMTLDQVLHLYSIGQIAPGPNMMVVAAYGVKVAGFAGALTATLAFFIPTGILTFIVGKVWNRLAKWPWRQSIQFGLAPVAVGLAVAGTITFGKGAITGWITGIIGLAVYVATFKTKINPVYLILGGAAVGVAALR
jgi:chromate transporter